MDDLQEIREYMRDPIIEEECGSIENFAQNLIDWTDRVNVLALRVRDSCKGYNGSGVMARDNPLVTVTEPIQKEPSSE